MHIVGEVSMEMRQSPAALRNAVNQDLERLMGNTSAPVNRGASLNNISPCRCATALRMDTLVADSRTSVCPAGCAPQRCLPPAGRVAGCQGSQEPEARSTRTAG